MIPCKMSYRHHNRADKSLNAAKTSLFDVHYTVFFFGTIITAYNAVVINKIADYFVFGLFELLVWSIM